MKFKIVHCNINVSDLAKSIAFYQEALQLEILHQKSASDDRFILTYMGNKESDFEIELTYLKDHPQPYDLGENESHIAFMVEDFAGAYQKHKEMGCICFENKEMGIYFIHDPDEYWLEIIPAKA